MTHTPSQDNWKIWLLLAGRGFGKTYTVSTYIINLCNNTENNLEIGLIGNTEDEIRRIMIEGPSGILIKINNDIWKVKYHQSRSKFMIISDTLIHTFYIISAHNLNKIRGFEFSHVWIDEWLKLKSPDLILQQVELSLRREPSKCIISTTPTNHPSLDILMKRNDVCILHGTSFDNPHTSQNFKQYIKDNAHTEFGQQEIMASKSVQSLWSTDDIVIEDSSPYYFHTYLLGIDIAVQNGLTGIILVGIANEGVFVIDDLSLRGRGWAQIVKKLVDKYPGVILFYEENQGGKLIEQVLRLSKVCASMIPIRSTNSKAVRHYFTYMIYKELDIKLSKHMQEFENDLLYQKMKDRLDALANVLSRISNYV